MNRISAYIRQDAGIRYKKLQDILFEYERQHYKKIVKTYRYIYISQVVLCQYRVRTYCIRHYATGGYHGKCNAFECYFRKLITELEISYKPKKYSQCTDSIEVTQTKLSYSKVDVF